MEEWSFIVGYYGLYEVSNQGRVRSLDRTIPTKAGGSRRLKGKLRALPIDSNGYRVVGLSIEGKMTYYGVHQLVAIAFMDHNPRRRAIIIRHGNGDRSDNRVENLYLVSSRENRVKEGGSSEYIGVAWDKRENRWQSNISVGGRQILLGHFKDEKEASFVYESALEAINESLD